VWQSLHLSTIKASASERGISVVSAGWEQATIKSTSATPLIEINNHRLNMRTSSYLDE
jgi:hypothetical protein